MKRFKFIRRGRHLAEDESGGTIAELAIIVPFLIVMVAAVTELGRFFQTYATLCKTTRASARYISKVPYDGDDGEHVKRARNVAVCGKIDCTGSNPVVPGLTTANIEVIPEYLSGKVGNPIRVTVNIKDYSFKPLFNIGALLNNKTLSLALPMNSSTTMYYMWSEPAGGKEDV